MKYRIIAAINGWESYIIEANSEEEAREKVWSDPDEYLENDDQDWSIVSIKEITNEV